jgi:hypothetical protein
MVPIRGNVTSDLSWSSGTWDCSRGGAESLLIRWLNGKVRLSLQDTNRIFRWLSVTTLKAALQSMFSRLCVTHRNLP